MKYKLLVLDLDGTLTNEEKKITADTYEALMQAQKEGLRLVLASGRPTYGILPLARQLEMEKYGGFILAFNGAKMIRCADESILFQRELPGEELYRVYEASEKYGLPALTYEDDHILTEEPGNPYVLEESRINQLPVRQVVHLEEAVNFPPVKFLLVGDGDYLASVEGAVREELGPRFSVYRSAPFFLEVMAEGIDKAQSLNRLLEYLSLSREELAACGDGYNDISMLRFAGLSAAMENGVEEAKEAADVITKSNEEDGVAWFVRNYLQKEK